MLSHATPPTLGGEFFAPFFFTNNNHEEQKKPEQLNSIIQAFKHGFHHKDF